MMDDTKLETGDHVTKCDKFVRVQRSTHVALPHRKTGETLTGFAERLERDKEGPYIANLRPEHLSVPFA